MNRFLGVGAVLVTGALFLMVIPFLYAAADSSPGLSVLVSLEGIDLGIDDPAIAGRKLDREQAANAYYLVGASAWHPGSSREAAIIAVMTALQESALRNLDHGDQPIGSGLLGETSRGLFQQMGNDYGYDVAMNPILATKAFLDRLTAIPGWQGMPPWEAAQKVQRSAHPDAYERHLAAATRIVDLLWNPVVEGGPGALQVTLTGSYALPIAAQWFADNPVWLTQPHHDYPASDLPVPVGTPVYAITGGLVIAAPTGGDCGNGVVVQGDDGVVYTYCHGTSPLVPQGVKVPAGQPVMLSGYSGHVVPAGPAGAHVHIQIKLGADGPLVCPQPALAGWLQGVPIDPRSLPRSGCTS